MCRYSPSNILQKLLLFRCYCISFLILRNFLKLFHPNFEFSKQFDRMVFLRFR
ncbi:hypothetical protein Hanom_Chr17g01553711 [Helianthus anomalus]